MKNFRFIMLLMITAFWSLVACDIPNQEITPIDSTNANVTTIDNPLPGGGEDDSDDNDDDDGEDDNDDGDGEDDDDN
ncbi:MAG: hypothetical protein COW03_00980 [Cytophagales bacterium CG12_big_fil_rev_8_21_14_0_65_40_12]|nr:MAG: hypothetical protein COW03_00980 [Cytophagales bacterium CG12_big_fil_rev_8_21_14_0_65_40_12]PIW05373.1 MAG: hypothetical protein COW40_05090 [Cytophagales bacterium CG17_big_fil_post_rev_8_21_14_2_50_40_13]